MLTPVRKLIGLLIKPIIREIKIIKIIMEMGVFLSWIKVHFFIPYIILLTSFIFISVYLTKFVTR